MVDMESANEQLGIVEGEHGLMLPPAPRAPKVRCCCLPPSRPSWLLAAGADRPLTWGPASCLVANRSSCLTSSKLSASVKMRCQDVVKRCSTA